MLGFRNYCLKGDFTSICYFHCKAFLFKNPLRLQKVLCLHPPLHQRGEVTELSTYRPKGEVTENSLPSPGCQPIVPNLVTFSLGTGAQERNTGQPCLHFLVLVSLLQLTERAVVRTHLPYNAWPLSLGTLIFQVSVSEHKLVDCSIAQLFLV